MLDFNFSEKGLGLVSQHVLCMIFQEICSSCYILLTDQIFIVIAFTSRDIGQYEYLNCLFPRL